MTVITKPIAHSSDWELINQVLESRGRPSLLTIELAKRLHHALTREQQRVAQQAGAGEAT